MVIQVDSIKNSIFFEYTNALSWCNECVYTNFNKYLFIQREFKALKARRIIEANSYSISKASNEAYRALKPALRETLRHSTSALH